MIGWGETGMNLEFDKNLITRRKLIRISTGQLCMWGTTFVTALLVA